MGGLYGNAANGVSINPNNARASISSNTNPSLKFHGIPQAAPAEAPDVQGGSYNGPLAGLSLGGDPFALFLGVVLGVMIIKYAMERTDLSTSYVHIGPINFVIVALMAWIGAVGIRLLLNMFPVPGLTQLANFGA